MNSTPHEAAVASGIDLNSIQITPSQFYLNRHGNLCLFFQFRIPGRTVEAIATEAIMNELVKIADRQIKPDFVVMGRAPTWDEFRAELTSRFAESTTTALPKDIDSNRYPFDATSLRRLADVQRNRSAKLSRQRDLFTLVIPLSPTDSKESVVTFELYRRTIAEHRQRIDQLSPGLSDFIDSFTMAELGEGKLQIVINFTQFAKSVGLAMDQTMMPLSQDKNSVIAPPSNRSRNAEFRSSQNHRSTDSGKDSPQIS